MQKLHFKVQTYHPKISIFFESTFNLCLTVLCGVLILNAINARKVEYSRNPNLNTQNLETSTILTLNRPVITWWTSLRCATDACFICSPNDLTKKLSPIIEMLHHARIYWHKIKGWPVSYFPELEESTKDEQRIYL